MSISEIIPAHAEAATTRRGRPELVGRPILPAVTSGQLWLIELPAEAETLSAPARHALAAANVVIYDRALAGPVADALPLGAYAEPATGDEAGAARAARFAQDGWSVARLLSAGLPQRARTRRAQDVVDVLAAARVDGRSPVTIVAAAADGIEERMTVRFDDLAAIVASYPRDTQLAIVHRGVRWRRNGPAARRGRQRPRRIKAGRVMADPSLRRQFAGALAVLVVCLGALWAVGLIRPL